MQFGTGALPCDAWHHFYHYQASAQYLWLAETLRALGRPEEALAAYDRAIFQDHFNAEALEGKGREARGEGRVPSYDKHPLLDAAFCASVGKAPGTATAPHDETMALMQAGDYAGAIAVLEKAVRTDPNHSNSFFALGKCYFLLGDYERAHDNLTRAVRLSHLAHDAYHRTASAEHLARGREFLKEGNPDLAVSDFTKALDLHRGNGEALAARAQAYRTKGNETLAREDEAAKAKIASRES